MSLVKVSVKERNGAAFVKDMLIDLSKITEPVYENVGGDDIIILDETSGLQSAVNRGNNNVQYILDGPLLSRNVPPVTFPTKSFAGTVIAREGRKPVVVDMLFMLCNVSGVMLEWQIPGGVGTKFLYEEKGGLSPVEYIISESIDQINSATTQANPTPIWYANVSQSGIDQAPELTPAWDGGAGKIIENTIEYNGSLVNISFQYLAIGTYRCVADQPIFADIIDFGIQIQNNHYVDVGGITSYGEVKIFHDPANPYAFDFITFDGMGGGTPQNDMLTNATVEIKRPC